MAAQFDANKFTADKADALEAAYRQKRKDANTGTDALEKKAAAKEKATAAAAKPEGPGKWAQAGMAAETLAAGKKKGAPGAEKAAPVDELEKRAKRLACINRKIDKFYKSPVLCGLMPPRPAYNRNDEALALTILAECRSACDDAGAVDISSEAVVRGMGVVERMILKWNMGEAVGLPNIQGLGQAFAREVHEFGYMQIELAQLAIELSDWTSASLEKRMLFKSLMFMYAYNEQNNLKDTPAPATGAAEAAARRRAAASPQ
jgi:hypothetical protein